MGYIMSAMWICAPASKPRTPLWASWRADVSHPKAYSSKGESGSAAPQDLCRGGTGMHSSACSFAFGPWVAAANSPPGQLAHVPSRNHAGRLRGVRGEGLLSAGLRSVERGLCRDTPVLRERCLAAHQNDLLIVCACVHVALIKALLEGMRSYA